MRYVTYILLLFPLITSAHVKWFTFGGEKADNYSIVDKPVLLWILVSILILALFYFIEKKYPTQILISPKLRNTVLTIADIGIGISFLIFSYLGFIFAPNILPEGTLGNILLVMQGLVGFCFIFGIYTRYAALAIIATYFGGVYVYGWVEFMDVLEILGFGVYSFIIGRQRLNLIHSKSLNQLTEKFHEYSIPLLRIFIGLNLILLGLSEKILRPDLGLEFLAQYNWNFTPLLGFPISDYWFVFSAGMVELMIGFLLTLGLLTRTVTVILAGFLITTLILLGPIELVGHLPHFSLVIILIIIGSGNKLKL